MKRFFACLLILCILTHATACIVLEQVPAVNATDEKEQATTQPQTNTPTASVSIPWSDHETTAELFLTAPNTIVDCSKRTYTYLEMTEDLAALQQQFPAHFSYRSFGRSVAGRELYVAILGNPNAEKQILVSAGIHGREYLTPLLVMKQIEYYLTYYDTGNHNGFTYASLFESYCFYIVPMTNPDGIMISQQGLSSLPNAVLIQNIMGICTGELNKVEESDTREELLQIWKANANGVDLNRNFDALITGNTVTAPSHKNYRGSAPESEPETRAMVELTESLPNIQAVLCIHSQGEVLYWNCGQDNQNRTLYNKTRAFTEMLALRNGYRVVYEQNNDASFSDWCALDQGLIAVTVETGYGSCPLEIDQLYTIWQDNFDLLTLSAIYFEN